MEREVLHPDTTVTVGGKNRERTLLRIERSSEWRSLREVLPTTSVKPKKNKGNVRLCQKTYLRFSTHPRVSKQCGGAQFWAGQQTKS